MIDDSVASAEITQYLRSLITPNDEFLRALEKEALEEYIPVIQPEVVQLLRVVIKSAGIKSILEIGTAVGYSAINFARECEKVVTVERDEDMVRRAKENIAAAGLTQKITVVCGDALEFMAGDGGTYDMIFVDAAKGQYIKFLPECKRLLKDGGILVSDNVLYRGTVAKDGFIPRKHRTIITNLKQYLYEISNDKELTTSILPIGDGVAISRKGTDDNAEG